MPKKYSLMMMRYADFHQAPPTELKGWSQTGISAAVNIFQNGGVTYILQFFESMHIPCKPHCIFSEKYKNALTTRKWRNSTDFCKVRLLITFTHSCIIYLIQNLLLILYKIKASCNSFPFDIKLFHTKVPEKPFNHLTWLVARDSFIAVTLKAWSYISLSLCPMHKHCNPHNWTD